MSDDEKTTPLTPPPRPPLRRLLGARIGLGALLLILIGLLAFLAFHSQGKADTATAQRNATGQRAQNLATQVRHACQAGGKAGKRLKAQGLCSQAKKVQRDPIVGPSGPAGAQGPAGPPPSPGQVAAAVASYCSAHGDCAGPHGTGPSKAQVAAAVTQYCDSRGQCVGPQGGKGDTGPPPADTAVAAAVADYCAAHGHCAGPAGPKGDTGDKGDSITGPRGPAGPSGPAGEKGGTGPAGYPDRFTFTDQLGVTYTCTDPDGDHSYTCSRATPAPNPT